MSIKQVFTSTRALVVMVILILLLISLAVSELYAQNLDNSIQIRYVNYIKLTNGNDVFEGTCLTVDNVIVVGSANMSISFLFTLPGYPVAVSLDRYTGVIEKVWQDYTKGAFLTAYLLGIKLLL